MVRHYLDHASSSPLRPEVSEAVVECISGGYWADPGRVHSEGRSSRDVIEDARDRVASFLGVKPRQVVFTSGGTEAANAAVWGGVRRSRGRAIVCSDIEHSSVREASRRAAEMTGAELLGLEVSGSGRISVAGLRNVFAASPGSPKEVFGLVSCQWANHEVGSLQPVEEIVEVCRTSGVLVHVDASAAIGNVAMDLGSLGADLVSVTAHKMGGPKGVGALVLRPGLRIEPLVLGGEQERGRRAGMENIPAIVGFGKVAELLSDPVDSRGVQRTRLETEVEIAGTWTRRILEVVQSVPGTQVYGDQENRLANIVCFGVEDIEAEALVLALDQAGIAVHSGSACSSESLTPSPVLEAMGVDAARSLRVSVGWSTTDADVDAFSEAFPLAVKKLRALRT